LPGDAESFDVLALFFDSGFVHILLGEDFLDFFVLKSLEANSQQFVNGVFVIAVILVAVDFIEVGFEFVQQGWVFALFPRI
jgi:hypothetical protein